MIRRATEEPVIEKPVPPATHTLILDGEEVSFTAGETIIDVTYRNQKDVPNLCYDPRLEPFGACRLCIVELEGVKNPVASCTTLAEPDMVVTTRTARLEMHRRVLMEMVASENRDIDVEPLSGYASQQMRELIDQYDARTGRFQGAQSGASREDDDNPFIKRDYNNCISCYRCVRVCAEQEGDYAISVMNRGFDTQITTELLADLKALANKDVPGETVTTRTICPYCGVGCTVDVMTRGERIVGVLPAMDGPANEGALCVKGQFAFDFVHHPDRLATPLVRGDDGELHETSWDEALSRAAAGFRRALDEHGRHSVYGVDQPDR
jgi:predicted molibdopterin-dependent oxidoreductase YjgC